MVLIRLRILLNIDRFYSIVGYPLRFAKRRLKLALTMGVSGLSEGLIFRGLLFFIFFDRRALRGPFIRGSCP